jgi:hypothetical protein
MIDSGYIFDKRLYIPASSPLLHTLIDSLISSSRAHNLNHLVMGFHTLTTSVT